MHFTGAWGAPVLFGQIRLMELSHQHAAPQDLRGVGTPPFIQGGFFMRRRPYADRLLSACRTAADAAERILHGIF